MVWDDMAEAKGKPTIAEMATSAVSFLNAKAGPEGFFIMIEVDKKYLKDISCMARKTASEMHVAPDIFIQFRQFSDFGSS